MAKLLLLVTISLLIILTNGDPMGKSKCPYGRPQVTYKNEIFGFVLNTNRTFWDKLPWDQLTTLALYMDVPDSLICLAHQHQVRVIHATSFHAPMLDNSTACQEYITKNVNYVKKHNMDGLNIDFEEEISNDSPRKLQLTNFMANLSKALHQAVPGSKFSMDLPFTPDGMSGFNYDALAISKSLDYIVIMAYDEMINNIHNAAPYARANSDYHKTQWGAERYIDIGVPTSKLIIAFPWYGWTIPCSYITPNHVCRVKPGLRYNRVFYKDMEQYYAKYAISSVMWDESALSPYFDAKVDGVLHQVRYDNPRSLRLKNGIPLELDLFGVGIWTPDFAPHKIWREMWATVPYKKNKLVT